MDALNVYGVFVSLNSFATALLGLAFLLHIYDKRHDR